jgi:predicted patatin/cPLA2 family phospholipase
MTVDHKQTKFNASAPTARLKAINLAFQGGGSHGAFMWGVLDRLLEDDRLSFDGITATSMGLSMPLCSPMAWLREAEMERKIC